jgi:hypothetical protein
LSKGFWSPLKIYWNPSIPTKANEALDFGESMIFSHPLKNDIFSQENGNKIGKWLNARHK